MMEITKEEWKKNLEKVSFYTFFHTLDWLEIIEKHYPWLKLKLNKNDEKLFPYFRYKNKIISLPFCEYGGPISNKKIKSEEIKKLIKGFNGYRITIHPFLLEQESEMSSFILELKNRKVEDIIKNFRKTTRHSIKYSEKDNLTISEVIKKKDLKKFYRLYVKSMKRNYAFPVSFKFIRELNQNKFVKTWVAKHNNQIISGIMIVFYKKYAHYIKSCNVYKSGLHANYALIWHAIRYALDNDFEFFDFGATKKSAKLSIFKRGWGTKEYPIPEFTDQKNNLNETKNYFLKKVWDKIPYFVFAKTSGFIHKIIF